MIGSKSSRKDNVFFQKAIDETTLKNPKGNFTILMSHRPDALDYSSEIGLNLVLAGHTHGAQVGYNGRSLFEANWPDRYLWGEYTMKKYSLPRGSFK